MKSQKPRNNFSFYLFIFYFLIVLPLDSPVRWKRIGHKIYSCIVFTIQILHITLQFMFLVFYFEDYKNVMAILSMCLHGIFRMLYIRWNQDNFLKLLDNINKEFYDESAYKVSTKLMKQYVKYGTIFTAVYICGNQLTCLQWFVIPVLLNMNMLGGKNGNSIDTFNKSFPTTAWYPFDENVSPWFEIVYFIQCFNIYTLSAVIATVDLFVMYFTLLLYGQFDVLKHSLKNVVDLAHITISEHYYNPHTRKLTLRNEIVQQGTNERLNRCVAHHQFLLMIVSEWEKMFNPMMIFVFLNIILVLVFSVFEATVIKSSNTLKAITLFELFFMGSWELFIFSWCGGMIQHQQESIAKSIYFTRWYDCSDTFKQSLRIMVVRSYSPILLTIGKLSVLKIECFTQEMSRVFSLYTVLWQMKNSMKTSILQTALEKDEILGNFTSNSF